MHMQRKSHTKPPVPLVLRYIDAGKCGASHDASLEMETEVAAEKGRSWSRLGLAS